VVWEGAEVAVAPAVVEGGAGLRVVAARLVEVVDPEGEVVSGVEVSVEVDRVVAVTEEVGSGRLPAGAEPPAPLAPLALPAGGGRTSIYRANTATKSRDSSSVEVRTRPCSRVGGSRPGGI
jgi:hypothetical protein